MILNYKTESLFRFKLQDKPKYNDDFGNSDQEDEPDAYLARIKAEVEERSDNDNQESEESTDEDFNPNQVPGLIV